jgi:hypothetical protein
MCVMAKWTPAAYLLAAALVGAVTALSLTDREPGRVSTVLVTAAVALLVAAITALTTDRRQDRQLLHEEERFRAQLAHDRISRDLEELRAVADEALAAAVELAGPVYEDFLEATAPEGADSKGLAVEWWALGAAALKQHARLELRLGTEHPVTKLYAEAVIGFQQAVQDFLSGVAAGRGTEARSRVAMRKRYFAALDEFSAEALTVVGSASELTVGSGRGAPDRSAA